MEVHVLSTPHLIRTRWGWGLQWKLVLLWTGPRTGSSWVSLSFSSFDHRQWLVERGAGLLSHLLLYLIPDRNLETLWGNRVKRGVRNVKLISKAFWLQLTKWKKHFISIYTVYVFDLLKHLNSPSPSWASAAEPLGLSLVRSAFLYERKAQS